MPEDFTLTVYRSNQHADYWHRAVSDSRTSNSSRVNSQLPEVFRQRAKPGGLFGSAAPATQPSTGFCESEAMHALLQRS